MTTIEDVIGWLANQKFIKNVWITIIVRGGITYAPIVISILLKNNKTTLPSTFTSISAYIFYLREN